MRNIRSSLSVFALCAISVALSSCSSMSSDMSDDGGSYASNNNYSADYSSRLPATISTKEKVVMVDPHVHAWGAYESGSLVKSGLATAGSDWCPDIGRPCHTSVGHFRVSSLGGPECKSKIFPVPKGGAPMPYCMFFHGGQALHGVSEGEVVEGNISHGCVRLHVADAEWLRFNFVNVGTKVIVSPY